MSDGMHPPTPHARRVAVLRAQARQLMRDAAAWGLQVTITLTDGPGDETRQTINVLRLPACTPPNSPPEPALPQD